MHCNMSESWKACRPSVAVGNRSRTAMHLARRGRATILYSDTKAKKQNRGGAEHKENKTKHYGKSATNIPIPLTQTVRVKQVSKGRRWVTEGGDH